ncbi:MAG: hypothetical protein MJZ09_04665 [Bacteroidales bacterium]|nr:hypothetical protein [Bacteroidales bacterium]
MEVSLTDKLSLINEAIASLQGQIDDLKKQLAEVEAAVEAEAAAPTMQVADIEPVEISIDDDMLAAVAIPDIPVAAPAAEETPAVEETPVAEDLPAEEPSVVEEAPVAEGMIVSEDLPEDDLPMFEEVPASAEPEDVDPLAALFGVDEPAAPVESINDASKKKAKKTVKENLEDRRPWKTAVPGQPVKSIISAIPLNDRVLFVNSLFRGDALMYQSTITAMNEMSTLDEVEEYVEANFPNWNLDSDVVYRFMMAVRRKVR